MPVDPPIVNCTRTDCPTPITVTVTVPEGHGVYREILRHLVGENGVDIYFYFRTDQFTAAMVSPTDNEPARREFPATFPTWKKGYTRLGWSNLELSDEDPAFEIALDPKGTPEESSIHVEAYLHGQDPERDWPFFRTFSVMMAKIPGLAHVKEKARPK